MIRQRDFDRAVTRYEQAELERDQLRLDLAVARAEVLHVEAGDKIVLTVPERLSRPRMFEEIRYQLKAAFPDNEAVILSEGLTIAAEPEASA